MITLFSTLKPKYDYRQRNAAKSWASLSSCNILLIGYEGQAAAEEFSLNVCCGVQRSEQGVPQLDALFGIAQAWSNDDLFLYVNADIILWDDIVRAMEICAGQFEEFLMVGQRTNMGLPGPIGEEYHLRERATKQNRLLSPCGCDYFGFTYDLWPEIPPYAIGRTTFDNWLIWSALEAKKPVIDVTKAVTVVHQKHGEDRMVRTGPDAKINQGLVPEVGLGRVGWVNHSTYVMDSDMQIKEREA